MNTRLGNLTREKNPAANGREAEYLNHVFVRLANGRTVLLSLTDHESARAMKRGKELYEPEPEETSAKPGFLRRLLGLS